jgi:ribosome maturation factor RimP
MSNQFRQLQQIIAPAVAALGYELVGCELHRQQGMSLLRVYVDRPTGVSLDDCAKISRQISAVLDVEDPISGRYHLEVSSPGLERPLFTSEHFRQFIGRKVNVLLRQPQNGRRRYRGVIQAVNGEQITLIVDDAMVVISHDNVDKANLIADFGEKK